jgi:SAM-dependent methyltransferase
MHDNLNLEIKKPPVTEDTFSINPSLYFEVPLVDLGKENEKFRGVLCPEPEVSLPKIGVSESLLSGAEEYFRKFQQFSYIYGLMKAELDSVNCSPTGLAVDFGSGFGNTVIPLLEHFPQLKVIATDISPDLLAILRREAFKREINNRCAVVAMDAQRDYFKPEIADVTFGCAMLHHMADPEKVVRTALKILKPGGHAIFFEPFELGCTISRLAYLEILATAKRQNEWGPGFDFLANLNMDIIVRAHRHRYPGFSEQWYNLDDKWLFTREYFEKICVSAGASKVHIRGLHEPEKQFRTQTKVALTAYGNLPYPDSLPQWAWDILDRYDNEHFSPELKRELTIEAAVVFTK